MLLSTSSQSRRTVWILAVVFLLGSAAVFRVWYVEPPPPPPNVPLHVAHLVNVTVDPLSVPDFSGGPELKFDVELETIVKPLLQELAQTVPKIQARRAEALKQFPSEEWHVPVREQATTQRQVNEEYFEYRQLELQAYRQQSEDSPGAKDAGERFLKAFLEAEAHLPQALSAEQVLELGQAALKAGSGDPLLRTHVFGLLVKGKQDNDETESGLANALPLLVKLKYPRVVTAMARVHLSSLGSRKDDGMRPEKNRWPAAVVAIVRWLEEESGYPNRRRSVYHIWRDIWGQTMAANKPVLLAGCLQSKKIDPWLLHTVLGHYRIERGWDFRGKGYADTVQEFQWKKFHEELSQASAHLQYAWFLQPTFPESATAMITVAMAGGDRDSKPHEWFSRAVEAQFDYSPAYVNLWNALLPRWGGSLEMMLEFGQQCVETNRFDTAVPLKLLDIVEFIRDQEVEFSEDLTGNADVQALLRNFLTRREVYRRGSGKKNLYVDGRQRRTRLAILMQECGLLKEAGAELIELGADIDVGQLKRNGRTGEFDLSVIHAALGADPEKVALLVETLRKTWNPETTPAAATETEALLQSLTPQPNDPRAKAFSRHAREMLQQLRAYSRGGWVDLKFDSELSGWEIFADDWRVEEATGALRMSCRKAKSQRMYVRALAAFRPPFTLEFDVEMLEPAPYPYTAGVQYAQEIIRPSAISQPDLCQPFFGVSAADFINTRTGASGRRDTAYVRTGQQQKPTSQFRISGTERHRIQLSLWDKAFELRVGDAACDGVMEEGLHPHGGLSLGEAYFKPSDEDRKRQAGELRLSNVRIRRLEMPTPPADSETAEDQESYWQGRLTEDEDDPLANLKLAWLDWKQRRLNEATLHARRALEVCPNIERAHGLLGRIEYESGRISEAAAELKLAVTESHDPEVLILLAEILATSSNESLRSGVAAQTLATRALQSPGEHQVAALAALAAACAELGDFERAMKSNAQAIELADPKDRARLQQRQENYKAKQPHRLQP